MSDDPLVLGGEFPAADREQWRELVEAVLNGAPFDKKLVHRTAEGLAVQPLYTADDVDTASDPAGLPGAAPFVRGSHPAGHVGQGWDIRQRHVIRVPADTNAGILTDLERGVTSVLLGATVAVDVDVLEAVLDGVLLDLAPIALEAGIHQQSAIDALLQLWQRRGVPANAALGSLRVDPLGTLARYGSLDRSLPAAYARQAELIRALAEQPGVAVIGVDATPYADAGASDAQELAFSLATAVEYLRGVGGSGIDVDTACRRFEFTYAATADQFSTIAKLRAARRLWARVADVSGASAEGAAQRQHAVTSGAMLTQRDPWVNMLRTTIACFAAGVGGADAVTAAPFDDAIGVPDEFARRIARNTQLLLIEESNLARVIDPAGGSWYVESLTDELARAAWALFQDVERSGGMAKALQSGDVAGQIDAVWSARLRDVATRRAPITGVSEFPDVDEERVRRPARGVIAPLAAPALTVAPLPLRRLSAGYEALRDAADAASTTPTVFLANLGPAAVHTARATFAKNFFEAGGIRALGNDGFDDDAALVEAFRSSGARLAVICSSDSVYADRASSAASALKAAGAEGVYLAGNPGDQRDGWVGAGVDEFIHIGSDVLGILQAAHDRLGTGAGPHEGDRS
ncbi:MAG: methylmalonyl-CoA mutase subunit beta [Acidimicrobiales bacterium]|nr:methylmalonyl-CoA mutase subunit beta [Acidimicrobiales bacterium]